MKDIINYFLVKEEHLIALEIQKNFLLQTKEIKPISQKDLHSINANLLLTNETNISYKIHRQLINSLITSYINSKFKEHQESLKMIFQYEQINLIENFVEKHIEIIPKIIEELHIAFLNSEFFIGNGKLTRRKSKVHLRENGAVYTLTQITKEIVECTLDKAIQNGINLKIINCLDFACGTGRFYFEAIEILKDKYALQLQQIICNNLFAIDMDETALNILRCKVISLFPKLNSEIIQALSTNIINRNALIPKATLLQEDEDSIDLTNDFKDIFAHGGFDVVFSNP